MSYASDPEIVLDQVVMVSDELHAIPLERHLRMRLDVEEVSGSWMRVTIVVARPLLCLLSDISEGGLLSRSVDDDWAG